MLSIKKLIQSFAHAYQGFKTSIREEQNLRIELFLGIVSIAMGLYFHLSQSEWMILILTIALVIGSEIFNTALESLVDLASPEINPLAKKAKDAAAAAVLVFSFMAVIIGLILFGPRLLGYNLL